MQAVDLNRDGSPGSSGLANSLGLPGAPPPPPPAKAGSVGVGRGAATLTLVSRQTCSPKNPPAKNGAWARTRVESSVGRMVFGPIRRGGNWISGQPFQLSFQSLSLTYSDTRPFTGAPSYLHALSLLPKPKAPPQARILLSCPCALERFLPLPGPSVTHSTPSLSRLRFRSSISHLSCCHCGALLSRSVSPLGQRDLVNPPCCSRAHSRSHPQAKACLRSKSILTRGRKFIITPL